MTNTTITPTAEDLALEVARRWERLANRDSDLEAGTREVLDATDGNLTTLNELVTCDDATYATLVKAHIGWVVKL